MPWSSWWKRGGAPGPAPKRVASSVEDNWERLVRAVLRRDRAGQGASSVGRLLQVADDIVDDDRNVARILCEHAYGVSLNLDPSNDGIGVLQFRAGLSSVIKQKLAKDTTGSINRQNESGVLWKFYTEYIKRCRRVDDVQREQERMRESGTFSTELGTSVEMKNTYATLRVLLDALQILVGEEPTDELGTQILDEVRAATAAFQNFEDNDELSPAQVNDVKAFIEDYCVRNKVRAATAAFQNFEDNDELSPAQVNDVKAFIEDYCVRNKDGGRGLESVVENWERLVRAVLKQEWAVGASSSAAHATGGIGIASAMAPSLGRITNIEQILQAVADIENDDLNVARILSEQAYDMAQSLDPSSDWRGVLQFKTGLVSVVRQKLAKKGGASIDRQNDIEVLWNFYLEYKGHHRVDEMQREQERKRESGTFSTEMGTRDVEMKMIYATLRGLLNALEILVGKAPSDRLYRQILDEVEALQDMVSPAPSSLIKGIAAVSTTAVLSTKSPTSTSPTQMESTLHHMPLQQLKDITNNFCHELGRGGFGVVYKGLLENGQMVAVKKLLQFKPSSQEQFENEVDLLINLMHPNIVRLVGYCYEMKKSHISHQGKFVFAWNVESLLCLECLTNGSLDKYISDASSILDWPTRCKIIEGVSYGLQYLHEQSDGPIIHLDLKPANILLDENMVPKITDFGLSRLFDQEQTIRTANTSGTLGYMSPEYLRGIITPKADIFSLGVIIMEIITGHREYPYDIRTSSEDFIELEVEKWRNVLQKEQGNTSLETDCQQIKRCLQIGLICVNPERTKRPTMKKIIDLLQGLEVNWYISNELSGHHIQADP